MKTPFKKLRGLGLHRRNTHRSPARLDELSQASQDMHDMKDCYDSLLSAAAATANSAYEFSESLREMGDCLLEKTSLNDDEDSGRVLLMLGKVQFEIQKLVDNYRAHISRTITAPSESLLSELRVVEDMKRECDEKRMSYDEMKIRHKDKRKGEYYASSHQVRAAQEEFDENATLFVFRMKSLKNGQSRSLLTQAARHHAAQMCFFRKALKSLEAIEPHVKLVTQQQYIDYQFGGLEDDDDRDSVFLTDEDEDEDEDDAESEAEEEEKMHEDGELSFEYQRGGGDPRNEASSSENSMELADITFPQVNMEQRKPPVWNYSSSTSGAEPNAGSKSAPLSAVTSTSMDPSHKFRQSSARKLNTYVLPTPLEKSPPTTSKTNNNLWHSSPLEQRMRYEKEKFSGPILNNTKKPTPPQISAKKIKRYAFSGPLAGSVLQSRVLSGGGFVSSPKISELHELPRPPPTNLAAASIKLKPPPITSKAGFSAPLVSFASGPHLNVTTKSQRLVSPSPPRTPVAIRNS